MDYLMVLIIIITFVLLYYIKIYYTLFKFISYCQVLQTHLPPGVTI